MEASHKELVVASRVVVRAAIVVLVALGVALAGVRTMEPGVRSSSWRQFFKVPLNELSQKTLANLRRQKLGTLPPGQL